VRARFIRQLRGACNVPGKQTDFLPAGRKQAASKESSLPFPGRKVVAESRIEIKVPDEPPIESRDLLINNVDRGIVAAPALIAISREIVLEFFSRE